MASKNRNKFVEPVEEYRTRFMYCSIGATLMCLGVIVLTSGLVVYILGATGPNTYVNNMLIHHQHDYNQTYWPIIISIILSSAGIAFITIAIVFTLLACFSHGRIENSFRRANSSSPPPSPISYQPNNHRPSSRVNQRVPLASLEEQERLISSPSPNQNLNRNECITQSIQSTKNNLQATPLPPPPPPPPPPLQSQFSPYVPVEKKQQASLMNQEKAEFHVSNDHHQNRGDINTIGLPLAPPKKVPPNGFSYLAHPEEIHYYHEYHHHRTSSGRNPTPPPPTRATVRTTNGRESVI